VVRRRYARSRAPGKSAGPLVFPNLAIDSRAHLAGAASLQQAAFQFRKGART